MIYIVLLLKCLMSKSHECAAEKRAGLECSSSNKKLESACRPNGWFFAFERILLARMPMRCAAKE